MINHRKEILHLCYQILSPVSYPHLENTVWKILYCVCCEEVCMFSHAQLRGNFAKKKKEKPQTGWTAGWMYKALLFNGMMSFSLSANGLKDVATNTEIYISNLPPWTYAMSKWPPAIHFLMTPGHRLVQQDILVQIFNRNPAGRMHVTANKHHIRMISGSLLCHTTHMWTNTHTHTLTQSDSIFLNSLLMKMAASNFYFPCI